MCPEQMIREAAIVALRHGLFVLALDSLRSARCSKVLTIHDRAALGGVASLPCSLMFTNLAFASRGP